METQDQRTIGSFQMSSKFKGIVTSLGKIQTTIGVVGKDGENNTTDSRYVTLAGVLAKLMPLLDQEKVTLLQPFDVDGNKVTLTTLLVKDEEYIAQSATFTAESALPHAIGSTVTYARRYCLMSLLAITGADADDDGNAGMGLAVSQEVTDKLKDMTAGKRMSNVPCEPTTPVVATTVSPSLATGHDDSAVVLPSAESKPEVNQYSAKLRGYLKKVAGGNLAGLRLALTQVDTYSVQGEEKAILVAALNARIKELAAQESQTQGA